MLKMLEVLTVSCKLEVSLSLQQVEKLDSVDEKTIAVVRSCFADAVGLIEMRSRLLYHTHLSTSEFQCPHTDSDRSHSRMR